MAKVVGLRSIKKIKTEVIKIKKQEVQEERDPLHTHKMEKRKYSQKGSVIVGQTERQKSEIKTQNTNTQTPRTLQFKVGERRNTQKQS